MEEGIFPHSSSSRSEEGVEEERRLVYVAMTRAMKSLVITAASERRRFGELNFQSPSRFLDEVPAELIDMHRSPGAGGGRGSRGRGARSGGGGWGEGRGPGQGGFDDFDQSPSPSTTRSRRKSPARPAWSRGSASAIRSSVSGTVVAVIGSGLDQKLKINFQKAGVKTVLVRYANLEPA